MFAARERRVHPGRDEKILTAWNALMIKGMARAARRAGAPGLSGIGRTGAATSSTPPCGTTAACSPPARTASAHLNAYLDDYAFLLDALLELVQARWSAADLHFAVALAEVLLEHFDDAEDGGFWFTGRRSRGADPPAQAADDEAMPSGNGVAAMALQRLGHLLGEQRYLDAAASTLKLAAESIRRLPYAHASLLFALDEFLEPPETLVIRAADDRLATWQRQARQGYRPRRLVLAIPSDERNLPGTLAAMTAGERPRIYRCHGTHCEPPVESLAEL